MSGQDKRCDWAMPDTKCWVANEGAWVKGKVVSFAGNDYMILIEEGQSHVVRREEFQIRPRDIYNYGKDKPANPPDTFDRRKRRG